jgi:hypothetical protein
MIHILLLSEDILLEKIAVTLKSSGVYVAIYS